MFESLSPPIPQVFSIERDIREIAENALGPERDADEFDVPHRRTELVAGRYFQERAALISGVSMASLIGSRMAARITLPCSSNFPERF